MKDKALVIVVTYNAMQWIDRCIQSVYSSNYPLDLFIIDNSSSDETIEYIRKNYVVHKIIQNEKNLGFGAANNVGLQYAIDHNYSYVYLLNQDAWIQPSTIFTLINEYEHHPEFGILSPMQFQANCSHLDSDFNLIFSKSNHSGEIISVNNIMAAHWLISRKCLLEVGGFSPTFHHYGEDDNYCDRARFKKFKIGVVPSAIAIHDRENRIDPPEKKLYLSFVRTLVFLSDFERSDLFAIYGFACDCVKYLFREKSFLFVKYIKELLLKYKRIKSNKAISMLRTAFLNN